MVTSVKCRKKISINDEKCPGICAHLSWGGPLRGSVTGYSSRPVFACGVEFGLRPSAPDFGIYCSVPVSFYCGTKGPVLMNAPNTTWARNDCQFPSMSKPREACMLASCSMYHTSMLH